MEAQGFCLSVQGDRPVDDPIAVKDEAGVFQMPEDGRISMSIPTELIPKGEVDGSDVVMNLRSDDSFLEDK